jgi:DNA-binding NarL/FixJ family response regulator
MYKSQRYTPQDVVGKCATDWISENVEGRIKAANRCFVPAGGSNVSSSKQTAYSLRPQKMSLHIHSLPTRDKEVLGQLAHSRSNTQIAKRLGITVSTVEKHRSKIRQTLGVSTESDLQLAAWIVANPSVFRGLCSRVFPQ